MSRRKKLAMVAGALAVVAFAGAAFAYFTSNGTGTGTADVGSSSTINLSSDAVAGLFPGGADVPVTVHVHNPGGGAEYVGTISGSVADNGGCLGAWFTVDSINYNTDVAAGSNGSDAVTNVRLADTGSEQDACQGATMTINW